MSTLPHTSYDIRTKRFARETLTKLSGVPISVWMQSRVRESGYRHTEDFIADIIESHGCLPRSYKNFEFVYFHVTTSSNGCSAIRKYGLLNLKQVYLSIDSELRVFFDQHDIKFDFDTRIMTYRDRGYDISYGACPKQNTEAHDRWLIGRKFFYDFATCGFLSVPERNPYGGQVHQRPEILRNVDSLLGLNLSRDWMLTHEAYEITAKVSGEKIVYDGYDNQSDCEMVLNYLTKAYLTAFSEPLENVLLIKNHIQIPPSDVLEILSLQHWEK